MTDDTLAPMAPRPFPVTNRMVLAIAVPMTLAYLTTPLLGIVDTAVVGQFGDAALLGGLAAGAIVFDVAFTTFNSFVPAPPAWSPRRSDAATPWRNKPCSGARR